MPDANRKLEIWGFIGKTVSDEIPGLRNDDGYDAPPVPFVFTNLPAPGASVEFLGDTCINAPNMDTRASSRGHRATVDNVISAADERASV